MGTGTWGLGVGTDKGTRGRLGIGTDKGMWGTGGSKNVYKGHTLSTLYIHDWAIGQQQICTVVLVKDQFGAHVFVHVVLKKICRGTFTCQF